MRRPAVTLAGCDPRAIAAAFAASPHVTDREHVARSLSRVPFRLHMPAVNAWAKRRAVDYRAANLEMLALSESFDAGVDLTASDDEIILAAERRARDVRGYLADFRVAEQGDAVRARLEKYCRTYGVAPPTVKTLHGLIARLSDDKWWRRALRRHLLREMEAIAIRLGFVHRRASLYVSGESMERRAQQLARNARILESVKAENDAGQTFTLAELASRNVSNPAVRRAELMTRVRGCENHAKEQGDVAIFFTITCPSRMHARYAASGEPVPQYDGTRPDHAQRYLSRQWAKARAWLKRRRIWPYGFRIVEPHHDAAPHWHMLLWVHRSQVELLTFCLRKYACEVDAEELSNEPARTARFDAKVIDASLGSAVGYIAKYIAKNIDGFRVGDDFEAAAGAGAESGDDVVLSGGAGAAGDADAGAGDAARRAEKRRQALAAANTCRRVDTWRSRWGVRQFQQVGGPPVTHWRELRRLGPQGLSIFDPLIATCDAGDWAGYIKAMGGITIFKRDRTLQTWRVDYEKENRYGEPAPAVIEGVEHHFKEHCRTRLREWQIIGGGHGGKVRQLSTDAAATLADGAPREQHSRRAHVHAAARPELSRGIPGGEQASAPGLSRHDVQREDGALRHHVVSRVDVDGFAIGSFAGSPRVAAVAVAVPWTRVNNCTPLEKSEDCNAWIADYESAERAGGRGSGPP